jgi:hypothetical protein
MIPTIYAAQPTVIPSQTYDKWWVRSVAISALQPGGDAHARIELVKFRTTETGVVESSSDTAEIEIENVLASAATDPALGAVVAGLLDYVRAECVARGIASESAQP